MVTDKRRWAKHDPESGIEDVALLILEWLAEHGVNAMIRVDPERLAEDKPAWTFVVSGGETCGGMRVDGASAAECLSRGVAELRDAGVEIPF
ncbi:hypothetical protein J4573_28895 [Actinomadura barringtoniae]|uniref:Uncharacterized protein n=1 Tax=Actinomadura barringtoniae TaxID=1427535 RepID=A0A939PF97_9ACTN|nr:hypothetical protein [Actinomadura barringtoniae]MBO2451142.1 hypothetical protein [Actinomadura barringtoniae]